MRRIIFSKHARFQLKERNISEQKVRDFFKNPDRVIRQPPNRHRLLKIVEKYGKDYLLVVVFERKKFSDKVITVFLTSKIKKYL